MAAGMTKRVHVTTPYPTFEEVARLYRLPKRRQKELEALAQGLFKRMKAEQARPGSSPIEKEENRKDASAAD